MYISYTCMVSVLVCEVEIEDHKKNIVKIVKKYEEKGGISKHAIALEITSSLIGGSRKTIWKAFNELIEEKQIELRPYKKQQFRLFTTDSRKKILEFEDKMEIAQKLLKQLEKFPEIGDCVFIKETDKIPNLDQNNYDKMTHYGQPVKHFSQDETPIVIPVETKCLQARYDILNNLPLFLVHYINMSQTEFSKSMKDESRKIINPIIDKCISMMGSDYTNSPYYSNKFAEKYGSSEPGVLLCKGLPLNDIRFEFLRTLGRYYFLISNEFSKGYKIDSCNEQKIISDFVTSFFPKSTITNDRLNNSIDKDSIINYQISSRHHFLKKNTLARIKNVMQKSDGVKFSTRYEYYGHNDPFIISNYYIKWIFRLDLFSNIEKTIIQTNFDESEDYEDEAKDRSYEGDEDAYEKHSYPSKKIFKGTLWKNLEGKPVILPKESFSKIRPYKGRPIKIVIDDIET